uniref:Uncharacterized protein n=1 Tax=Ditylenchus dipsaci TaxID=166011 RepID=A0A915E6M9_9BILA
MSASNKFIHTAREKQLFILQWRESFCATLCVNPVFAVNKMSSSAGLLCSYPHEEAGAEIHSTHSSKETSSTPIFGLATEEREARDVSGEPGSHHPTTPTVERKKREEIELGDADEERKEPESPEQSMLDSENGTSSTVGSKEKEEEGSTTKAAQTAGEHAKKDKRETGSKETEHAKKEKREAGSKEVAQKQKRMADSKEGGHAKKEKRQLGSEETEHAKKEKRGTSSKEDIETTTTAAMEPEVSTVVSEAAEHGKTKRSVRVERNANNNHKNRPVKPSHGPKPESEPHP